MVGEVTTPQKVDFRNLAGLSLGSEVERTGHSRGSRRRKGGPRHHRFGETR